jgi:vacuole morphology and inheritance protein 14
LVCSIEEFIPLLKERMNVLNPYVRQFLVGWITVLDSVPDIDMLGFLPDFLDGLFNMLSDSSHEIRQQADSALSEFLQEIKNSPSVDYGRMAEILVQRAASPDEFTRLTAITWINEFVKLGGDQLVRYYADILGAILPCISDKEEKIRVVSLLLLLSDGNCRFCMHLFTFFVF